jgi:hypothetical protein
VRDWYLAEQRMTEVVLAPLQHSSHPSFISMPTLSLNGETFFAGGGLPLHMRPYSSSDERKKKREKEIQVHIASCAGVGQVCPLQV